MALVQQGMAVVMAPMGFFLPPAPAQVPVASPVVIPQVVSNPPVVSAVALAGASELLLAAVQSLYRDGLEPYGRILRKRLSELSQAAGHSSLEIGTKELRVQCEACPGLEVLDACPIEGGADWAARLRGVPPTFVNIYSAEDPYPADMWVAAAAYFSGPAGRGLSLPGGRYACAQNLMRRQLPFLAGRTLGEICHIVQLSTSVKKLLGYHSGAVVPYSRSQSMVKERCAERCRPCTSGRKNKIATWDMVRKCVQVLIDSMEPGQELIQLSNIKRTFRLQFKLELSETALGYAKLSELLQDECLHDLCRVCLQGHGYALAPMRRPSVTQATKCSLGAPSTSSSGHGHVRRVAPLCIEEIEKDYDNNVQCTATSPSPVGRPASLPKLLGRVNTRHATTGSAPEGGTTHSKPPAAPLALCSELDAGNDSSKIDTAWAPNPLTPSTLGNLGFKVQNTFIHAALPPPTPVRVGASHRRSVSLPRDMGSAVAF